MTYATRQRKKSQFTQDSTLTTDSRFDYIKNGINKGIPWGDILDILRGIFDSSIRVYATQTEMEVDDTLEIGDLAIVVENRYAFYEITSDAAAQGGVTLDSGRVATQIDKLQPNTFETYEEIRGLDTATLRQGEFAQISTEGMAGTGFLRNVSSHGLTDNGGTIIVIDSGWYWERSFSGGVDILWWDIDDTGATDENAKLAAAASASSKIIIPKGSTLKTSVIPNTIEEITGGGKLLYTTVSAFPGDTYTMPDTFILDGIEIQTEQRNRLKIKSNNLVLKGVVETLVTTDTDPGAYSCVEWEGTETFAVTGHVVNDSGFKLTDSGDGFINGLLTNVNNKGKGTGIDDGTDGVKISVGSGNLSDITVIGCSRDVIDGFVSSGRLNINNVWSDTFVINGIEIKTQEGQTDALETPYDVTISNVWIGEGGEYDNDNFAGLFIVSSETSYNKGRAPRRVNVSNVNIRGIGANQTSGQYYGIYFVGFSLSVSNCNILNAEDYGMRLESDCEDVKITNSNIHGKVRGISCEGMTDLKISNSNIGIDEESGDLSTHGIFCSNTTNKMKITGSEVHGDTNAIRAENATINQFKASNSTFLGAVRIDAGEEVGFNNCDIISTNGSTNAFASVGSFGQIEDFKYIGGIIKDGSRAISKDNLNKAQIIGVTFKDNNSVMFGTADTNNHIVTGCISDNSGSFPSASGNDIFANNIEI